MNENNLRQARRDMYRLLGRLYLLEVDEELLSALLGMEFPKESPVEDMQEGYDLIGACLQDARERLDRAGTGKEQVQREILDDLAVDYARIFLSAGVAQGKAAFPFESVYTSRQHLLMQESRTDVLAKYTAKGLTPSKDMYRVPEDHLGLLLSYMAILCEEDSKGDASLKEQQEFLTEHLQNWVFAFTADVAKYASTDFYRGLGKLTKGFLTMERSLLTEK